MKCVYCGVGRKGERDRKGCVGGKIKYMQDYNLTNDDDSQAGKKCKKRKRREESLSHDSFVISELLCWGAGVVEEERLLYEN